MIIICMAGVALVANGIVTHAPLESLAGVLLIAGGWKT